MASRIRLSRARGWRMPANTVKVDRTTSWGNPFVVGRHGTAAECVALYDALMSGALYLMSAGAPLFEAQRKARLHAIAHIDTLRGRNLACWCALDKPCHADVLLRLANAAETVMRCGAIGGAP